MICGISDIYSILKPKTKKKIRYTAYYDILLESLIEMFDYQNLPDSMDRRFIELPLHLQGQVFIGKPKGKDDLVSAIGTLGGDIDAYGLGTECIAPTPIGEIRGKRNDDVAYGINNDLASPDILIYWISHMLGEVDLSAEANTLYARYLPIPKLNDEKDKAAFSDILKKLQDGELSAFVSKNVLASELGSDEDVFNITDVDKISRIQYLSRFADDLLKRFYNFYGHALQTQNKSAQVNTDELHGMDSVSFILPIQMLKRRKELIANVNRIFGTDITVSFSEPWQKEFDRFASRDLDGDGNPDQLEPKTNGNQLRTNGDQQNNPQKNQPEPAKTNPEPAATNPEPAKNLLDLIRGLPEDERETVEELVKDLSFNKEETDAKGGGKDG